MALTGSLIAPFFEIFFIAGNISYFDPFLIFFLIQRISKLYFFNELKIPVYVLIATTLIGFISLITNSMGYISSQQLFFCLRWLYLALLLILIANYIRTDPSATKIVISSIIFSTIITLTFTWVAWFVSPRYLPGGIPMLHLIHDESLLIINRNYLGFFLSIPLGALFYLLLFYEKKSVNYLGTFFSIIFIFTGILFTFSKGSWAASTLPILFVSIYIFINFNSSSYIRRRPKRLPFIFFCSLIFVWIYFNVGNLGLLINSVETRFLESSDTNNERVQFIFESMQLMMLNPIFGVGPGLYRESAIKLGFLPTSDPHNALLWIGSEHGVFIFFLFILVIFLSIKYLIKLIKKADRSELIWVLASGNILLALICNIPIHGLSFVMKHFWIILGVIIGNHFVYRVKDISQS